MSPKIRATLFFIGLVTLFLNTAQAEMFNNAYLNVGLGADLPTRNSSTTANSNAVFDTPDGENIGLFMLSNVKWQNKYQFGYDFNIALGFEVVPNWRVEGEFLYQRLKRRIHGSYNWIELDSGGGDVFAPQLNTPIHGTFSYLSAYSFLANLYYDFTNCSRFTPFIGAGAGGAWLRSRRTSEENVLAFTDLTSGASGTVPTLETSPFLTGDSVFIWQIKTGLTYDIDCHLAIIGLYRLSGTSNFKSKTSIIQTNPASFQTLYIVPAKSIHGLLTNAFELNLRYTF